jgi:hypothetical protein
MPRESKYLQDYINDNTPPDQVRTAVNILREALDMLELRGKDYGPPAAHYHELADIQSAFFVRERTARDVALANVLEKLDRIQRTDCDSAAFRDSFIDAIAYLAIAWECS